MRLRRCPILGARLAGDGRYSVGGGGEAVVTSWSRGWVMWMGHEVTRSADPSAIDDAWGGAAGADLGQAVRDPALRRGVVWAAQETAKVLRANSDRS